MKITPLQLDAQLRVGLKPWYWVAGDEPLQLQETAQRLRAHLAGCGYDSTGIATPQPHVGPMGHLG